MSHARPKPVGPHRPHRTAAVEAVEPRRLLAAATGVDVSVRFEPAVAQTRIASAARVDAGGPYVASDGGTASGWTFDGRPWLNTWTGVEMRPDADGKARTEPYASLGHRDALAWEMDLPAGTYDVSVVAGGSAGTRGEPIRVAAEGRVFLETVPTAGSPFSTRTVRVDVTDGRLTLTAPDGLATTRLVSVGVKGVSDAAPVLPPPSNVVPGGDVTLGGFEQKAYLPFPAMEGATAALNGKLYAWGGYDRYVEGADRPLLSNGRGQVYDAATDTWSAVADLPAPLTHGQAAVWGGKIYIFGGFDDGPDGSRPNPETYVYDPADNTMRVWGEMPYSVSGYGLAQVGSRAYLISGFYGTADDFQGESRHMFSIDLADPSAGYRDEPDAPVGREHVGAAVVDGKIYFFGGETGHDQYVGAKSDVHVYDPATRQWTQKGDIPGGGLAHVEETSVVVGGKILVAGGNINGPAHENFISTIRLYDPATDQWSVIGDLPEPRRGAYVRVIGDYLYVAGGDGDYPRNTLWRAKLTVE